MSVIMSDVPGTFREDDGAPVPFSDAKYKWAQAGYGVLVDVARTRDRVISFQDFADAIRDLTGIGTNRPVDKWVDAPLSLAAEMCVRNTEPPLTALVVSADTRQVGDGFAIMYSIAGQILPGNLQRAAAQMRVACYDHFARREAVGWDKSKLTGRVSRQPPEPRVTAEPKPRTESRPVKVCSRCHLQMLPSGRCAYCD